MKPAAGTTKWALITGSSSGIGREFALVCAREGYDTVLCARREEHLRELAEEIHQKYNRSSHIISADLSEQDALDSICENLKESGIEISLLINNAGFGNWHPFHQASLPMLLDMIRVNVSALTELTHRLLPDMIRNNAGIILNVASVAGFQPGPYMAVYYATKAFVLSLSQALAEELRRTNIQVSVLCPGPIKTEFGNVARSLDAKENRPFPLFDRASNPDAHALVKYAWRQLQKKRRIIIFNAPFRLLVFLQRFMPRKMILRIMTNIQEYKNNE